MRNPLASLLILLALASPAIAQGPPREENLDAPRPIAAVDVVWIQDLTWMEVRDAMKAGKTTVIIPTASTEQNGPYVPTGKHYYVLVATAEATARKLGNALVAPIIPFEPGAIDRIRYAGTLSVRPETYEALVTDVAASLKQQGFRHIVLIGDSGGNQRGLESVARRLSEEWAGGPTTIHFVREYYDSWQTADKKVAEIYPNQKPEGIHDDYSVNSILITVGKDKIRFDQRVAANKASINNIPVAPAEKTLKDGRQLVEIRAEAAAGAIRKAIAGK